MFFHISSLTVRPSKTKIGYFTVEYLGINVGRGFTHTTTNKVKQYNRYGNTKDKKKLNPSLVCGNHRHYPNYATITAPLTDLSSKLSPNIVNWEICHQDLFN